MKTCALTLANSKQPFHATECTGLVQSNPGEHSLSGNFPITFHGLSNAHGHEQLPLNDLLNLATVIEGKSVDAGYLLCSRLLRRQGSEQVYLASFMGMDLQKLHLLECILQGLDIRFRELDPACASSWLSACSILHFSYGYGNNFSSDVLLDTFACRAGTISTATWATSSLAVQAMAAGILMVPTRFWCRGAAGKDSWFAWWMRTQQELSWLRLRARRTITNSSRR